MICEYEPIPDAPICVVYGKTLKPRCVKCGEEYIHSNHDTPVTLGLARDLYKRLTGRSTMNAGTYARAREHIDSEVAYARWQSYETAIDDLCRISGFTKDQLK